MAPSVTALDNLGDAVFATGNVSVDDVDLDFSDKATVSPLLQGSLVRTHSGFIALPVKNVIKSDSTMNVMPIGASPMDVMKIVDFKAIAQTIVVGKLTLGGKMAAGAVWRCRSKMSNMLSIQLRSQRARGSRICRPKWLAAPRSHRSRSHKHLRGWASHSA